MPHPVVGRGVKHRKGGRNIAIVAGNCGHNRAFREYGKRNKSMRAVAVGKRGPRSSRFSMLVLLTALATLALGGCDDFPNDIAATMDEVTETGVLHAGIVADGRSEVNERSLAEKIADAAGAEAEMELGSAEVLLHQLEEGELDIVVGKFANASPWNGRVALTEAPNPEWEPARHEPVLRAAVRNGENRWLMFVSRTIGGDA